MKVAFIGTGSMGSILIEAFLRSGALHPHNIHVSNRSAQKSELLARRHPGISVYSNNAESARGSQIVFLCVKPMDFPAIISDIKEVINEKVIVVSITSPVQIDALERQLSAKIAKIIPSITHSVHSGASLCIYGSRIQSEDRLLLEQLMSSISIPTIIKEHQTRIASDISSCGPAFVSFILQQWAKSAAELTGISEGLALKLGAEMLLGTGKLLTEGGFTPEELQKRVAVPGGVTAEGIRVLSSSLQGVFSSLIQVTHDKYDEDLNKLSILFPIDPVDSLD
ncbi:Pyrroline-5-carboxylate reductase [compost metagenome]